MVARQRYSYCSQKRKIIKYRGRERKKGILPTVVDRLSRSQNRKIIKNRGRERKRESERKKEREREGEIEDTLRTLEHRQSCPARRPP